MSYQWHDSLSVGQALMDLQHQRLFAINQELSAELKNGVDAEELQSIVARLLAYTRSHFAEEEWLMQQADFPDFAHHKELHDALTNTLIDLEVKLGNGQLRMVAEFLPAFVGQWLTQHIAVADQQYARYIRTEVAAQAVRNRL